MEYYGFWSLSCLLFLGILYLARSYMYRCDSLPRPLRACRLSTGYRQL